LRLRALQEQVDDQIDMAKQVGGFPAGWQRAGQGLHLWPADEQTKKQRRQFMGICVAAQLAAHLARGDPDAHRARCSFAA